MTEDTPDSRATTAAAAFMDAVNEMSFDDKAFARQVLREHRTLQQNAMRVFLAVVREWSALTPNKYDARNEWTVGRAKEIIQKLGEFGTQPPFI